MNESIKQQTHELLPMIKKEFSMQNRHVVALIAVSALFMQLSVSGDSFVRAGLILMTMTSLLIIYPSMSGNSHEEESRTVLLLLLPVKRPQIVIGNFLMIGIWYVVAAAVFIIVGLLCRLIRGGYTNPFFEINSFIFGFFLSSILLSLYFACFYCFPRKYVQIASQVIWMLMVASLPWISIDSRAAVRSAHMIIGSAALLAAVVVPLCYWLALRLFAKKDIY